MLQLRASIVLKELIQTSPRRLFSDIIRHKKTLPNAYIYSAAYPDGRISQLKTVCNGRPFILPLAGRRFLCTKTEGAIDPTEPVKKDESVQEATAEKKAGILPSLEDLLFYSIAEGQERIPAHKFITALKATGLRTGDPRLKECMDMLKVTLKSTSDGVMLDRHLFKNIFMVSSLMDGVIMLTTNCVLQSLGDTKVPFCLQSCVKPLKYAIAVHDHGTEYVHRFIGKEPSGLRFNKLFLDEDDKPHNPMVNAGAIVCTSLIKQGASNAEKFDYMMSFLKMMAGNEYVGFSNATFQSERESGDRNFAIGYYLKEKKCFPDGTDMTAVLDLYFQLCSIEVTCESASVMAATLANGGFCPITGERVLSPESVRDTLSLMHSCGMYDFSGQFAFHVGLPAKSGVAGGILLVVPNVMGVMCWSPPLDKLGNSVRGIQFCTDLVSLFNFHNYDNLRHFAKKHDPRREGGEQRVKSVINLLFAAYTGDVSALRRFALSSMDMEQRDYDSRTALHVAAAEGHIEVVRFLLEACKVNPGPKDRWGNMPIDEATHFGHHEVLALLQEYNNKYNPPVNTDADKESTEKNLDGMLET
uniref:glutaminase n=1 Tax=Sinocyclocheilus grahami TaxID=75366 RepID=A0A672RWM7_SINGR